MTSHTAANGGLLNIVQEKAHRLSFSLSAVQRTAKAEQVY